TMGQAVNTLGLHLRLNTGTPGWCLTLGDFVLPAQEAAGDILIGGLFPLHIVVSEPELPFTKRPRPGQCSGFDFRAFRWLQTMVFAIEEINRDPDLLPGIQLGYRILDSCDHVHTGLRGALSLVNGSSGWADADRPCLTGAPVSYFATCECLKDKRQFPSFLRTVPSDLFQVRGLVQLVAHFGWRWVGAIGTEDDYSRYGIQAFREQLAERGGCLAFYATLPKAENPERLAHVADALEASSARVILAFSTEGQLYGLLSEVARRNLTGRQWIASEAWVTASLLSGPQFRDTLAGTLGFAFRKASMPALGDFLLRVRPSPAPNSVFVNAFWEELFGCRLDFTGGADEAPGSNQPSCSGAEDVRGRNSVYSDVSQLRVSYNVYKAVYAIAHALHRLLCCDGPGDGAGSRSCGALLPLQPRQVDVCLLLRVMYILHCSSECMKCPQYHWSDPDRVACLPMLEEFLSFQDILGVVLALLSVLGVTVTLVVTGIFYRFRDTPIVRANNSELSFLLLASLALCFLCALLFIGRPSPWSCWARQATFGVAFVLCISCILAKTMVVLVAFWSTIPGSNAVRLFGPTQQRALIFSCTAVQVVLCVSWLTWDPPSPIKNTSYQAGRIILECQDGAILYLVLGYIGLLSCICFDLAFLGRKLPDTFNEAKLITFSMLIFFAVWISFIPAHLSSPGKYTVAVEIFAILASSFSLLLCIFLPKCFIILLKPEKNIKKGMVSK
uniref:Olfactory receptor C family, u1 n=1 Tax=Paramormyrops kingsleyae TaxID=1676925 RepID=A0A3B3QWA2_9TELE